MVLYAPDGRRWRRAIGYLIEYRLEPERAAAAAEVDAIADDELALDDDDENQPETD